MSKNSASDAQKQWELENNVKEIDYDHLFKYDEEQNAKILETMPWKKKYVLIEMY